MNPLGATVATLFSIGMVCVAGAVPVIIGAKTWNRFLLGISGIATGGIFVMITLLILAAGGLREAFGRDLDGRYAASPLKPWFDQLRSAKGPCCSDADGSAVSDADWESSGGHFRVRVWGQWLDVPDEALITEPNRAGRTMVWPVRYHDGSITIRCFMPGSMS